MMQAIKDDIAIVKLGFSTLSATRGDKRVAILQAILVNVKARPVANVGNAYEL